MAGSDASEAAQTVEQDETGSWDPVALATLSRWDPIWAQACVNMSTNLWSSGILPRKSIELIAVALSAACTNLDAEATRRHARAALAAGATRDELLLVLKMGSLLAIHSCSLGAPMLLEEAAAAGVRPAARPDVPTPSCDRLKAMGLWNEAWDSFVALDPLWTDEFMATGIGIYASGLIEPKLLELLSIALDASYTHMYAPGTRRHIKAALALGATMEEIIEVLKICVVHGVQACNLGVPILNEELARHSAEASPPK